MKTSKRGRKNISFKDLQIAYLKEGLGSITKLYQEGKASKIAIQKAFAGLKETGTEVVSLEQWVLETFQAKARGRAVPAPGSERIYKAQKIRTSGSFLRLPLDVLHIEKSQLISVIFEKDKIIVQKKNDSEKKKSAYK